MLKITSIDCFTVPGEEKMDTPLLQRKDTDDNLQRTYDISHRFTDVGPCVHIYSDGQRPGWFTTC